MNALLLVLWTSLLVNLTLQNSMHFKPDQSQFFGGVTLLIRCEELNWKVWRSSEGKKEPCETWGTQTGSWCKIDQIKPKDSGQYWCQSEEGRLTESYRISVIERGAILKMPVLPVTVGQTINMICQHYSQGTKAADFYRDGQRLTSQPTGRMILQQVALFDKGLYSCESLGERSQQSELRVKPVATKSPPPATTAPPYATTSSTVASSAPPLPQFVVPLVASIASLVLLIIVVLVVLLVRRCRCRCRRTKDSKRKKRRRKAPPQPGETTRQCKHQKGTRK